MTKRSVGAAVALVCFAQFVLQLDFSIVNVALPSVQHDLDMLTQFFGWRSIFLINPPIVLAMLLLARNTLPQGAVDASAAVDVRGGLRAVVASAPRQAAVAVMLLMGAVIAAYVYFVSLYLQRVLGFSPALAGLGLVPSTLAVVIVSTSLMRPLLRRIGVWPTMLVGLGLLGLGQLWLVTVWSAGSYPAVVLPGLILTATGMGFALPAASVALTNGVEPKDAGVAGALFVASQQIGGAVGLAVLATLAAARTASAGGALQTGYSLAFLVSTALIFTAAGVALTQVRRRVYS